EEANIQDQSEFIFSHFIHSPRVRFSELTKNISSKIVLIVTLMAILEMMKTQQVYISQDGLFEDFVIEKVE
ncbi:MAG: segregation/condensation protein A, partial [Candidatus Marinimicrobia bacterium]|nr:segregation/condensation protein A [Candidatus Neomarinimicrobiota bacterium]